MDSKSPYNLFTGDKGLVQHVSHLHDDVIYKWELSSRKTTMMIGEGQD